MTNGSVKTKLGKNIMLYRTYTQNSNLSSTQYLPPSIFRIGINSDTPTVSDTSINIALPISDGTVNDDGSNTMTGSSGGDNSTDNTTTYKDGGGTTDVTAQNLIANATNATKIWTISDLASAGTNCDATEYIGLWFYIKDATTLAKFASSGTCLEIRIGADSTTNYYSKTYEASDLATGWNWLSEGVLLSTWTENGTPGTLNDFQIRITTNNATDTFVAGDVIYDLLRQWTDADTKKSFVTDYPVIDLDTNEVTVRGSLSVVEANGFLIDTFTQFNEDTTELLDSKDVFDDDSKSSTDSWAFVAVDRLR